MKGLDLEMIEVEIADITLRESEQVHASNMSFKEKLETAKLLEKLQVDIIETGFIGDSPTDTAFIRTLASTLEYSVLSVPVVLDRAGVDAACAALLKAKKPRLNLVVSTSPVGMEYQHQMKAEKLLTLVGEMVSYCVTLCPDIELTAEDSVRSEPEFLSAILKSAINAGVKTITLCDSVGELLPDELSQFIASVYEMVPELHSVSLALLCRDSLGLASATALNGISSGVRLIKVSSGAGYDTLSLEQFMNVLKVRGETLGISSGLNTITLQRTCAQLLALTGATDAGRRSTSAATDSTSKETGLPEDVNINQLRSHIVSLGYDVTEDDLSQIFIQFKEIARSKKVVGRDIEALIAETAGQAPPTYQLGNYVINSGSAIAATAYIEFVKNGFVNIALSAGDGPIDAAFRAAEQILGTHYELEEFQIQAVTGGREATGDALIKLRHGGKLYSGRGVSTDIVGASIRAYLSAVNKILYETDVY